MRLRHEEDKNIEDNKVEDVKNLFRLKKEITDTTIKYRKSFLNQKKKKENEAFKDRVIT